MDELGKIVVKPFSGALVLLASSFGILGLSLISGLVLARLLGVEARGMLAAILIWPSIVVHLGDLGAPLAFGYLSAAHPNQVSRLRSIAVPLTLVQTVVLGLLGSLIVWMVFSHPNSSIFVPLVFLWMAIPLNLLARYLSGIVQGQKRFEEFGLIRSSLQLTYTLLVFLLFIFRLPHVEMIVGAMICAHLVWCGAAYLFAPRPQRSLGWSDKQLLRQILAYGSRAQLGHLAPIEFLQLDLAFVVALLGAREAGLYAVALSAAAVLKSVGIAVGLIMMPAMAQTNPGVERSQLLSRVMSTALIVTLVLILLMEAGAGFIIPFAFGDDFSAAVPLFRILIIGMAAAAMRQMLSDSLRGAGLPWQATLAEMCGLIVFGVLVWPLSQSNGAYGVAVSAALASSSVFAVLVAIAIKLGASWKSLFIPKKSDWRIFYAGMAQKIKRDEPLHTLGKQESSLDHE